MRAGHLLIPMLALSAACVESVATVDSDLLGEWTLSTVNGEPLPMSVEVSDTRRFEIIADDITLHSGGALTGSTTVRLIENDAVIRTETFMQTGTWTRDGDTITLRITDGGQTFTSTAVLITDTLTIDSGEDVFVYVR